MKSDSTTVLYSDIREILDQARKAAYNGIRAVMTEAYWNIGKRIVEEEQQGDSRAKYGEQLLRNLADALTLEFGRGYSYTSLKDFRQFYIEFPDYQVLSPCEGVPETRRKVKGQTRLAFSQTTPNSIGYTHLANLQWSHYQLLIDPGFCHKKHKNTRKGS